MDKYGFFFSIDDEDRRRGIRTGNREEKEKIGSCVKKHLKKTAAGGCLVFLFVAFALFFSRRMESAGVSLDPGLQESGCQ